MSDVGFLIFFAILILLVIIIAAVVVVSAVAGAVGAISQTALKEDGED